MAIGALPSPSWHSEASRLDGLPLVAPSWSETSREVAEKLAKSPFQESMAAFLEDSILRSSACSPDEAQLNTHPVPPSFQDEWTDRITSSLESSWETWELPLPADHPFWASPSSSQFADSPLLDKWQHQAGGTAPQILSLFATLPESGTVCNDVSEQIQALLVWDSWLKKFGTNEEFPQLARYFQSLAQPSSSASAAEFPARLAKKFPLKVKAFETSMQRLFPTSQNAAGWQSEYLALWSLYAKDGLRLHRKMEAMTATEEQTPFPSDFLTYRMLTSGFPQLALLAARNTAGGAPEPQALEAVYPLLALGSMVASTFSDLFLASRGLQHKSAAVSALDVYGREWTVTVHNSLLALFHEEADAVLTQALSRPRGNPAAALSRKARKQAVELMGAIKASLHGLVLWYQTAPAFKGEAIAESLDLAPADADQSRIGAASPSSPLAFGASNEVDVPSWVADTVDSALERFSELLTSTARKL